MLMLGGHFRVVSHTNMQLIVLTCSLFLFVGVFVPVIGRPFRGARYVTTAEPEPTTAEAYRPCDMIVCPASHPCQPLDWNREWCMEEIDVNQCLEGYEWCELNSSRDVRYMLDVPARTGCNCPTHAPCQSIHGTRIDVYAYFADEEYQSVRLTCHARDGQNMCVTGTIDCGVAKYL